MNTDPSQLLRMLEPAVRPAGAPLAATRSQLPVEAQSFDALLTLAREGGVRSGRAVTMGFETPVEMEPAQLDRLSGAADRAEAAGARKALLLMDGAAFTLDVADRLLTEDISTAQVLTVAEVDHAVVVPGAPEGERQQATGWGDSSLPHAMHAMHTVMPPSVAASGAPIARGEANTPVESTSAARGAA